MNNSQVRRINPTLVPTVDEAITFYENAGGQLTRECCVGLDPLMGNDEAIQRRERMFMGENPSFDVIFNNVHVTAGGGSLFEDAVLSFIRITNTIAQGL